HVPWVSGYCSVDLGSSAVTTATLDEYRGLPREHAESYWSFMHRNLFDLVNINPASINLPDGTNMDAEAECARYDYVIKRVGGIEIGSASCRGRVEDKMISVTSDE